MFQETAGNDGMTVISQHEVMRVLRTDSIIWNMIMAMLIPIMMKVGVEKFCKIIEYSKIFLEKHKSERFYYRTILQNDSVIVLKKETYNSQVMTANQLLMLSIRQKAQHDMEKLKVGYIDMTPKTDDINNNRYEGFNLRSTNPSCFPEADKWVKLREKLEFKWRSATKRVLRNDREIEESESIFDLRSVDVEEIDNFISECIKDSNRSYTEKQALGYMYACHPSIASFPPDKRNTSTYVRSLKQPRRLGLSVKSVFDGLFFDSKDELISRLDEFINKTGNYSANGVRHKLVIFLYGPPGTGKTTLTQAIAAYLGRENIIYVPPIPTKDEFFSILSLSETYYRSGANLSYLKVENSIHVFEEIEKNKFYYNLICHSKDMLDNQNVDDDYTDSEGCDNITSASADASTHADLLSNTSGDTLTKNSVVSTGKKIGKYHETTDLSLSDFIECLDGSHTSEDQVIIITTNADFESFSSFVKRPGRVDLKLYLGHLTQECALSLACYYIYLYRTSESMEKIRCTIQEVFSRIGFDMSQFKVAPTALIANCVESRGEWKVFEDGLLTLMK
jgi:hypothetical protein